MALRDGRAAVRIDNTGNRHLVVQDITFKATGADGGEVFSKKISGWYVLAGASRVFGALVPRESCMNIKTMKVMVRSHRLKLKESQTAVTPNSSLCRTEKQ